MSIERWWFATLIGLAVPWLGCRGEVRSNRSAEPVGVVDGAAEGADGQLPGTRGDGASQPDDGDGTTPTGTPGPGAKGCKPLVHEAGVDFGGMKTDKYTWYDQDCKLRAAGLVPSDAPGGGGFARGFTYEVAGRTRNALGTNANGWNGFGYLVNHGSPTTTSRGLGGSYRVVLAGAHHAIHEFKTRMNMAGPVDVTVHWFFATGRSHPIFAITHDSTPSGPSVVNSDSRSPYGDLAWDEGLTADNNIDGVGWGDKYQFVTTGPGPLTTSTGWDYTKPNTVPYAMEWANKADAEMGLVQTQTFEQQPAGGDYGKGVLASECWMRTSESKGAGCSAANWTMPHDWLWPMQLNQWELPGGTTSHRVAWGTSDGAVGLTQYNAFGKTLSGYPYLSYSVAVVLGTHSGKAVERQRTGIEVLQASELSATRGRVAVSGPGGVGRSDAVTYAPAGYSHVYGTWELTAASNAVTASLNVGSAVLEHPILRVHEFGAGAPSRVRVGGKELVAGEGYFASVDAASRVLWITLNAGLTGTTSIEIE